MKNGGDYFGEIEKLAADGFPEVRCRALLHKWKWPKGARCDRCGCRKLYVLPKRPGVLLCARCRRNLTATSGTTLHRAHAEASAWFRAAYVLVTDPRRSTPDLAALLGCGLADAFQMKRKLRLALERVEGPRIRLDKYRAFRAALGVPTKTSAARAG